MESPSNIANQQHLGGEVNDRPEDGTPADLAAAPNIESQTVLSLSLVDRPQTEDNTYGDGGEGEKEPAEELQTTVDGEPPIGGNTRTADGRPSHPQSSSHRQSTQSVTSFSTALEGTGLPTPTEAIKPNTDPSISRGTVAGQVGGDRPCSSDVIGTARYHQHSPIVGDALEVLEKASTPPRRSSLLSTSSGGPSPKLPAQVLPQDSPASPTRPSPTATSFSPNIAGQRSSSHSSQPASGPKEDLYQLQPGEYRALGARQMVRSPENASTGSGSPRPAKNYHSQAEGSDSYAMGSSGFLSNATGLTIPSQGDDYLAKSNQIAVAAGVVSGSSRSPKSHSSPLPQSRPPSQQQRGYSPPRQNSLPPVSESQPSQFRNSYYGAPAVQELPNGYQIDPSNRQVSMGSVPPTMAYPAHMSGPMPFPSSTAPTGTAAHMTPYGPVSPKSARNSLAPHMRPHKIGDTPPSSFPTASTLMNGDRGPYPSPMMSRGGLPPGAAYESVMPLGLGPPPVHQTKPPDDAAERSPKPALNTNGIKGDDDARYQAIALPEAPTTQDYNPRASQYYGAPVAAAQQRVASPDPYPYPSKPSSSRLPSQVQPAQPLRQPQPPQDPGEVCIECMMRDQDMIDVDVTSPGIWARSSDVDFDEALRAEEAELAAVRSSSEEEYWADGTPKRSGSRYGSRESMPLGTISSSHSTERATSGTKSRRKRLGRGQKLTSPALRLWTNMNPPASNHRWKTLQKFLATQAQLLELEKHARQQSEAERSQREFLARHAENEEKRRSAIILPDDRSAKSGRARSVSRNRMSTVLPNGMMVETIDIKKDDKEAKAQAKRNRTRRQSTLGQAGYPHPVTMPSSPPSIRSYSAGDQPWLGRRRFSSPGQREPRSSPFLMPGGARSSTDLRNYPGSLSPSLSPSRASVGADSRLSIWSRGRRSATQSMLSLAPSGSMMDMHLGLFNDKHLPPPPLPEDAAQYAQAEQRSSSPEEPKKKKKGLKGLLSKLNIRGDSKKSQVASPTPSIRAPVPPQEEDYPLAPPPPLSILANEQRQQHGRNRSSSSFSHPPLSASVPPTPPLPTGPMAPDRRSMISFRSGATPARSPALGYSPVAGAEYDPFGQPEIVEGWKETVNPGWKASPDARASQYSDNGTLRREKSLPALPPPDDYPDNRGGPYPSLPSREDVRSAYSFTLSPSPTRDVDEEWDQVGGGQRARAKSKVFSFRNSVAKRSASHEYQSDRFAPNPALLTSVARDEPLVAFRY